MGLLSWIFGGDSQRTPLSDEEIDAMNAESARIERTVAAATMAISKSVASRTKADVAAIEAARTMRPSTLPGR